MTWLVFGVSCLLVLAGAVSVISGAPIIQLERGWAEVIAGTVALSSGGVVFALAAILMRLEAVREAIAAGAGPAWRPALPVVEDAADPIVPARPVPPTEASASTEAIAGGASSEPASEPAVDDLSERHGLWKRVRRSEPQRPPAMETDDRPRPADVMPPVSIAERETFSRSETEAPVEVAAPPAPLAADIEQADERRSEQSLGWLDRSLFRARTTPADRPEADAPAVSPTDEPAVSHTEPDRVGEAPAVVAASAAETGHAPEFSAAPAISHMPAEVEETEPAGDDVTVIGRYQAGVASYIMYSDGTIQVETEGGELHRFASMDELKAYIASQDTPVS